MLGFDQLMSRGCKALSIRLLSLLCLTISTVSIISAHAASSSSANFNIPTDAINAGVDTMTSSGFRLNSSVGDGVASGRLTSANFTNQVGLQASVAAQDSGANIITFPPIADRQYNIIPFTINATASSGLPVSFTSLTPLVCSVTGNSVRTLLIGLCTLRASQPGNQTIPAAIPAAIPVNQSFRVLSIIPIVSATLTSSQNPSIVGQSITLTARIIGSTTTGVVTFDEPFSPSNTVLCSNVPVVADIATCVVPAANRGVGIHFYRARYQATGGFPVALASILQLVSPSGVTISLSGTPIRPIAGSPFVLTALVNGIRPTGSVRFTDSGVDVPGCANVALTPLPLDLSNTGFASNAVAVCTIAQIQSGNRNYTSVYSGDTNNASVQTTLSFAVAATGPRDYSDLWWAGLAENGWGMSIMQKGAVQFNTFYIYDAQGKPTWVVMPGGAWDSTFTRFSGPLYQTTGSPYFDYDASRLNVPAPIGNATLTFTNLNAAVLDYTISGQSGRKQIARQPFGVPDSAPRLLVRDMWWGGQTENGWGLAIAQQDRNLFTVWFTYDAGGKPTWYVVSGGKWDENVFTGDVYTTTSSAWIGTTYDTSQFKFTKAGEMTITFTDQDNAVMTTTIDGVTQSKPITRQPF
jgi:Bacterial Ig-like domain (group 3)